MKTRVVAAAAVGALALGLGFGAGVAADRQYFLRGENPDLGLIQEVASTIRSSYVRAEDIQPDQLTYAAIDAMVESLGDTGHSRFLTAERVKAERAVHGGYYEGIGAEVLLRDGMVVIVAPLPGSPAEQAGLRPGDVIIAVDGASTEGLDMVDVVRRVKGPPGSVVTLTVLDLSNNGTRTVRVSRRQISVSAVGWQPVPGAQIAHLHIASFSKGAAEDLKKALAGIEQAGLRGIVLDLRNDPGGLESEAIAVASQFLKEGDVLLARDARGRIARRPVEAGGRATDIPLVVIVNQGSASASEVVAGALQDSRRAVLVGSRTFGAGTLLDQFDLSDGSALVLATREWLTPSGRAIWRQGLEPDIPVALDPGAPMLLPGDLEGLDAAQLQASGDRQLLAAIEALGKAISG